MIVFFGILVSCSVTTRGSKIQVNLRKKDQTEFVFFRIVKCDLNKEKRVQACL